MTQPSKLEQLAEKLARSLLRARGCKTEGPLDEIQFGNIAMNDALAIIEDFSALRDVGEGWQPIDDDTPRDGTWFLGYWPDCNDLQNRICPTNWFEDGDESRFMDDSDWRDWTRPTHWRPLPAPPAKLEDRNDG